MKTKTRKELFAEIEELRTRLEVSEETLRTLQGGDKVTLKEIAHLKKTNETFAYLASFPELNPNPMMEVDLAGNVHYLNPALKQLFPDLQTAVLQHPWLVGLESLSEMLKRERKSSHVREVKIGETWYQQTIYPVLEGKRLRIYGLDITARKQAEEAFHESEKDLNRAQAVAHTGSWRLDIRRNELLWPDETHRIFGIIKGTPLTYEAFLATVHPDDRQMVDQSWQAALRGEPYDIEHRILVEGNIKWVHERAELVFDKEGSLQGGFGTVQDITERKQVEEKLKYSEKKYRELYEGSQDGFVLVDMEGHIQEFNHAYMEMLGYSEEELVRLTYMDLTPQKWHAMEAKIIQEQVLSKGYSTVYEKEYIKKDGTIFPISLRTYLIKETHGNPKGMWAFVRDITKRKEIEEALRRSRDELEIRVQERTVELSLANEQLRQEMEERQKAEQALRKSETKYRIVADNTYDWEWWLSPENKFFYISPSCKRITDHEPKEFLEDPDLLFRIIHPEDLPALLNHQNEIEQKIITGEVEFRIVRPDGSYGWISHVCQPVFDQEGNFLGRRGSNRDITERKLTEEALRESENRLRLLSSQLLSVQEAERKRIARELHDGIGQTLTAIKFKLEDTLQEKGQGKSKSELKKPSLETLKQMVKHSIEEVRKIQMDLRPSTLDDLGILATISWFTREFGKIYSSLRIEKRIDLQEAEVPDSLKTTIFRVIQESLNNTAKHSKADLVYLSLQKTDGGIELRIDDNGMGFDLENTLSLKSDERGYGLSNMRERIELSGGSFTMESSKGKGTLIRASWPLQQK